MKKLTAIILCILLVLSLAACGKDDDRNHDKDRDGQKSVTDDAKDKDKDKDTEKNPSEKSDDIRALEERYSLRTEDGLEWEYTASTKSIVISGEGPMRDYYDEIPEWDKYANEAERVVIGDEVTSVGAMAFYGLPELREISLGEKVEYIGEYAFQYCTNLLTVNYPDGLRYIGNYAFANALFHSDCGFILPEGLLYVGNSAFYSAFKESFVALPASLSCIGEKAFDNCFVEEFRVAPGNPKYIAVDGVLYAEQGALLMNYPADKKAVVFEIPNTVTAIRSGAVQTTGTLERIVIPASVSNIEEEAFFWNYALGNIDVAEDNQYYTSIEGVLFTKDGKLLLCYPIGSERADYTVPSGTEIIAKSAFSGASDLQVLVLGEELLEIHSDAFRFCSSIFEIYAYENLQSIDENAFNGCDAVTKVFCKGDSLKFESIQIKEGNQAFSDNMILQNTDTE